jgi:predicted transposase YdaD
VPPDNPHDALFKAVFGQRDNAGRMLRSMLPQALVDAVQWDSLTVEPGTFVDPGRRRRESDLLFSARIAGTAAHIYVVFEHQSSNDPSMALRLLRYMVRIWTLCAEAHPRRPLPLIVPLVLSHAAGGWTAAASFRDLLDPSVAELAPDAIPDFRYAVLDVANASNAQLRARPLPSEATLTLWLLRDIRNSAAFLQNLASWSDLLAHLERHPAGEEKLQRLWYYVAEAGSDLRASEIRAILDETTSLSGDLIMNMLERARAEGAQKGRLEGHSQGKAAALRLILQARGLSPSEAQLRRIDACDDAQQLDDWTLRASVASALADVFGD